MSARQSRKTRERAVSLAIFGLIVLAQSSIAYADDEPIPLKPDPDPPDPFTAPPSPTTIPSTREPADPGQWRFEVDPLMRGKGEPGPRPLPDKRSRDEIAVLYIHSFIYGVGTAAWIGTLTKPTTAGAPVVSGLVLAAGSIGTVMALDSDRGLRYGVAQSIVSGMYIGLEEGVAWTLWAASRGDSSTLQTTSATSLIWGLSTGGAVMGGVLGNVLGTTPGRSAWVGSTALWMGTLFGLSTGSLLRDGGTEALAASGVALTIGTGIGLASAGAVSPSIARVRWIDLSATLGLAASTGLYFVAKNDESDARVAAGAGALGLLGGLVVGWLATSSMKSDPLRQPRKDVEDETSSSSTTTPRQQHNEAIIERMRPMLLPARSGAMIGALGTLD